MAVKGFRKYTPEEMIDALRKRAGNINETATYLKCHRSTIGEYVKRHDSIRDALEAIRSDRNEEMNDVVENKLFEMAKNGNTACVIFWAKTRMRDRGFIERDKHDWRELMVMLGRDPDKELTEHANTIKKSLRGPSESIVQRV